MDFFVGHDIGNRGIQNARAQPRKDVRTMAKDLIKNGKAVKSSTGKTNEIVSHKSLDMERKFLK
jgi:hypothetical protein